MFLLFLRYFEIQGTPQFPRVTTTITTTTTTTTTTKRSAWEPQTCTHNLITLSVMNSASCIQTTDFCCYYSYNKQAATSGNRFYLRVSKHRPPTPGHGRGFNTTNLEESPREY
ncbi:hypothetical protein E2C01_093506 [Portunus trituberculatus]|uniref:Uncharacterized protein n=1 Tax=Portunus trituberculatus TaxID=210409 RepID=A0A5B7JUL5_PORTR|nr:hypothetical protein [Portunus trituberculatus]